MFKHIRTALFSGLILAASAQAAQKINISFPFRTPAGTLPAGQYLIEMRDLASSKIVQLTNLESRNSVIFPPENAIGNKRDAAGARMVFSCANANCNLTQIWTDAISGYGVRQTALSPAEAERLTIVLRSTEVSE